MNYTSRARNEILDLILTKQLTAGEALQERGLSEQLEMSRTPVREALRRLEAEGIVERRGKALVVRMVSLQEVKEALAIREQLEPFAAQLAAMQVDLDQVRLLSERIRSLRDEETPIPYEHRNVDDDFHTFVSQSSGNSVLVETVANLRLRTTMFDLDRLPARFVPGCEEHLDILEALAAGDGPRAAEAMKTHIQAARQGIFTHLMQI